MKWAVNHSSQAVHTYRANLSSGNQTELYNGSLNDLLASILNNNNCLSTSIPKPRDVDILTAGSPCQGYLSANNQKENEVSLRDCSLIARVLSLANVLKTPYMLLENVLGMSTKGKGEKQDRNVFSQVIYCLVSLGYQVKQCNIDAWNFGSAQSRSRLFIIAGAPGKQMPLPPPMSHTHPSTMRQSSIGIGAHGLPFGKRCFETTPFNFISSQEATGDLPDIGDARVQACIQFPDHRTTRFENYETQTLISQIPRAPFAQNFAKAWNNARINMPQSQVLTSLVKRCDARGSGIFKAWGRMNPHALMPTITTTITLAPLGSASRVDPSGSSTGSGISR